MTDTVVGVILAGGQGRRLGGAKAAVDLGGRPLVCWPLDALHAALGSSAELAVVAKPGSVLPDLDVAVWREPPQPSHPLVGVVRALEGAGGRPALVCPVDVPFVTPATLRRLVGEAVPGCPAALACGPDTGLQPLLGCWTAGTLPALRQALAQQPLPSMRALAAQLAAVAVAVDEAELVNVNTAADLEAAQARLRRA